MKYIVVISLLAFFASCRKSPDDRPQMEVSKTTVKRGELVTASILHAPPGTHIYWQLPGEVNQVSADSTKASTLFTREGTYKITASLHAKADTLPYAWFTKTITVTDEDFILSSLHGNNTHSFNGDQVVITPFFMRDSTLAFILNTVSASYNLNTYIVAGDESVTNQIIKFSLNGIWREPAAKPDQVPVKSILFTRKWYWDGSYPIEITFNNVMYKGMLSVANNRSKNVFTWLHTSGVMIEPKVISRP